MAEQQNINSDTRYITVPADDRTVSIVIQRESALPNIVQPVLNLSGRIHINNVRTLTGELCVVSKHQLDFMEYELNERGELIINAPDADNYSIDENGYLIYTTR